MVSATSTEFALRAFPHEVQFIDFDVDVPHSTTVRIKNVDSRQDFGREPVTSVSVIEFWERRHSPRNVF